jgi:pimeloyl-ACP methyl ester carboxylesterase
MAIILGCSFLAMGTACAPSARSPDLNRLYSEIAGYRDPYRNPIIVIPGLLGSKLVVEGSGEMVWGAFGLVAANPNNPTGARLVALPMAEGEPLSELRDEVVPNGALDKVIVSFLGFPVQLNAYYNILRALGVGGYRDEELGKSGAIDYGEGHFTCFQFAYDWRRDIVESAQELGRFIEAKRRYVAEEIRQRYGIEDYEPRFDIVAHSMGALVVRYYLRYGGADLPPDGIDPKPTWAGARQVERVVMVAPPNAGAGEAVENLVKGARPSVLFPFYEAAILGTMPALYQLLPRARHGALVDREGQPVADLYDPDLWRRNGWGLADPGQGSVLEMLLPDVKDPETRYRIALEHQAKSLRRARRFAEALDVPARRPAELDLYLVAGDAEETPSVIGVASKGVRVAATGLGDGTVLRSSALMDERGPKRRLQRLQGPIDWSQTLFLAADHRGITKHPEFTDNILYFLLESPDGRPE